jgi:hypothetical protein
MPVLTLQFRPNLSERADAWATEMAIAPACTSGKIILRRTAFCSTASRTIFPFKDVPNVLPYSSSTASTHRRWTFESSYASSMQVDVGSSVVSGAGPSRSLFPAPEDIFRAAMSTGWGSAKEGFTSETPLLHSPDFTTNGCNARHHRSFPCFVHFSHFFCCFLIILRLQFATSR